MLVKLPHGGLIKLRCPKRRPNGNLYGFHEKMLGRPRGPVWTMNQRMDSQGALIVFKFIGVSIYFPWKKVEVLVAGQQLSGLHGGCWEQQCPVRHDGRPQQPGDLSGVARGCASAEGDLFHDENVCRLFHELCSFNMKHVFFTTRKWRWGVVNGSWSKNIVKKDATMDKMTPIHLEWTRQSTSSKFVAFPAILPCKNCKESMPPCGELPQETLQLRSGNQTWLENQLLIYHSNIFKHIQTYSNIFKHIQTTYIYKTLKLIKHQFPIETFFFRSEIFQPCCYVIFSTGSPPWESRRIPVHRDVDVGLGWCTLQVAQLVSTGGTGGTLDTSRIKKWWTVAQRTNAERDSPVNCSNLQKR